MKLPISTKAIDFFNWGVSGSTFLDRDLSTVRKAGIDKISPLNITHFLIPV
jgi:hypothetical protein